MGKSLRGKECGKGICQRKDGLYYARFVDKTGRRHEKYLPTLPEARNYYQYALILKIGLTWDAIDWKARTLTVNKTLEFRHKQKVWRAGPPKTQHSYRTIPLTDRAYEILKGIWDSRPERKESPTLDKTLEYIDRRTGVSSRLVMRDLVFINWRTGEPAKNSSYDTHLYKLCDEAGIRTILYARFAPHLCNKSNRKRYAAKGAAKTARSCKYKNNDGQIRPCHI